MKNKNGISTIVATLMIILLAIVAFGIISIVIRNTVTKSSENVELDSKCLDVEIHATKLVDLTNQYNVTISRSARGDPVDGITITLYDAAEENSISNDTIQEKISSLDKKTYSVNKESSTFIPAKVQVTPYFLTKSGSKHYCSNSFTDELVLQ